MVVPASSPKETFQSSVLVTSPICKATANPCMDAIDSSLLTLIDFFPAKVRLEMTDMKQFSEECQNNNRTEIIERFGDLNKLGRYKNQNRPSI